jgi:hypothetical protein
MGYGNYTDVILFDPLESIVLEQLTEDSTFNLFGIWFGVNKTVVNVLGDSEFANYYQILGYNGQT